jgi:RNA polymerase sigma-70 factor (ECF subfamily)
LSEETLQRPVESSDLEVDESGILEKLRAGDDAAYEWLVRSYSGRMLAVARRFLRSEEDARDAVQEAFLNAFRAMDRFEGGSRLSTWLHRIVVNACLMRLRTRRRKPEESIDELLPRYHDDGHPASPAGPWRPDVSDQLESAEVRLQVREAIDRLPDTYRTVLLLRDIEEFDTEEAARLLDISRAAVKTRLHRARQALRELLDSQFRLGEP